MLERFASRRIRNAAFTSVFGLSLISVGAGVEKALDETPNNGGSNEIIQGLFTTAYTALFLHRSERASEEQKRHEEYRRETEAAIANLKEEISALISPTDRISVQNSEVIEITRKQTTQA